MDRGYTGIGLYLEQSFVRVGDYGGRGFLTANVPKLPVLEYKEVFPRGYLLKTFDCPVGEIINDVCMCFEYANGVADLVCEAKESGGGMNISGDTQVGLLD